MDKPTVSITLLTYNHEKYVDEAINSILMQKCNFEYEVLVADDYSTDKTLTICEKYTQKYPNIFRILSRNENIGATRNQLDAWENSRGEFICTLEGDDYWSDENKLQIQVDFLKCNSEYVGVSHCLKGMDNLSGVIMNIYPIKLNKSDMIITLKDIEKLKFYSASSTLYNAKSLNLTNEEKELFITDRIVGDLPLCCIALHKGNIYNLAIPLSVYRMRSIVGESNYNSINKGFKLVKDHIIIINAMKKMYKDVNFSKMINQYMRRALSCLFRTKDYHTYNSIKKFFPMSVRIKAYLLIPFRLIKKVFKYE